MHSKYLNRTWGTNLLRNLGHLKNLLLRNVRNLRKQPERPIGEPSFTLRA